jgi:hypothetical protein
MKKIIISLIGAALLFGSCEDRLNIPQKGVIAVEDFYQTDEDAENALYNTYQSLAVRISNVSSSQPTGIFYPLLLLFNEPGDDMLAAGNFYGDNDFAAQINEFRYDTENGVILTAYRALYDVVYASNLVLDNTIPDTPVKKRVVAEARAIRAWAHMMLAIGWNNPPLVDHILAPDALPANYEGGQKGLLEWCATEAEAAVADLNDRAGKTDKVGASRATKGFAWTVAGKARLFMGDYAGAKTALKNVISSGNYDLVPKEKWANIFHQSGDLSEEMIFQINTVQNPALGWGSISRARWQFNMFWNWRRDRLASKPSFDGTSDGWGGLAIRADFAEKMLANDGDSPRRKATFLTADEFLYEMEWDGAQKRDAEGKIIGYATKAELETHELIGIKNPDGLYGLGEYFAKKTISWPEDNAMGSFGFQNYTVFRYAEVLLMYAEACAQTNDPDGLQYLNKVQTRAGSAHISTELNMTEVKNEKMFEMWLEAVRWPDMVRWGDTGGVVNNGKNIPSAYDKFFTTPKEAPIHEIAVKYSNPNDGITTGFVAGKHEFFPFPYTAINVNPNLIQNPGW